MILKSEKALSTFIFIRYHNLKYILLVLSTLLAGAYCLVTLHDEKEKMVKCDAAYEFAPYFAKEVTLYLTPFEIIVKTFENKGYFSSPDEALEFMNNFLSEKIASEVNKITLCHEKEALQRAKRLAESVNYEHECVKKRFKNGVFTKCAIPLVIYLCAVIMIL